MDLIIYKVRCIWATIGTEGWTCFRCIDLPIFRAWRCTVLAALEISLLGWTTPCLFVMLIAPHRNDLQVHTTCGMAMDCRRKSLRCSRSDRVSHAFLVWNKGRDIRHCDAHEWLPQWLPHRSDHTLNSGLTTSWREWLAGLSVVSDTATLIVLRHCPIK